MVGGGFPNFLRAGMLRIVTVLCESIIRRRLPAIDVGRNALQTAKDASRPSRPGATPGLHWLSIALIVAATLAAYSNSLHCPFVYDDSTAIVLNPHVRALWPLSNALSAPAFTSISGRPLVAFSLALNYAVSALDPWSYHAVNLALHLASALLLLGILRRVLRDRYAEHAELLAAAIALLWAVHPLNTQAVTYVIQRCESMMGFFFLLTLYLALRGFFSTARRWPWLAASTLACLLGMACKEVMVGAPLIVLLVDRQFASGSFAVALRKSPFYYAGLAASWIALALLLKSGNVVQAANLSDNPMTSGEYLANQGAVILHYIGLALWPAALCFDYGWPAASSADSLVPGCALLAAVGLATLFGVVTSKPWSLLGAWFFITLAPSSSLVPLKDLAEEYRMYLALAAVLTGAVLLLAELARRITPALAGRVCLGVCGFAALLLSARTYFRNQDYQSVLAVWQKVVQQRPEHARGHNNLGYALVELGRKEEAVQEFRIAVKLLPRADFLANLGITLNDLGHAEEAIDVLTRSLAKNSNVASTHAALGNALAALDRNDASAIEYKAALQLAPDAALESSLGVSLSRLRRFDEAMEHFQTAVKLAPNFPEAFSNMGQVMLDQGKTEAAIAYFAEALKLNPKLTLAEINTANAYFSLQKFDDALSHLRNATTLDPDQPGAYKMMGDIFLTRHQPDEAVRCYRDALTRIQRINPSFVPAYLSLANAQVEAGQLSAAITTYESALQFAPNDPGVHNALGEALLQDNHPAEAAQHFARALELAPQDPRIRQNYEAARRTGK